MKKKGAKKDGKEGKSKNQKLKSEITIKFEGSEILERTASKFGTGAHIIIPKEHSGKKVKIIIEDENKKTNK